MEVSGVDSISDTRCGSPLKHCIDLCSLLAEKGMEFTISVKIDNSFEFKLKSQNSEAPRVKKRSPSYLRRQERRKFLKKKLVSSPAESMNTREESGANKCSTSEDLSDDYIRDKDGYIIGYLPADLDETGKEQGGKGDGCWLLLNLIAGGKSAVNSFLNEARAI